MMADPDMRDAIARELISPERLPRLLCDPFANYVIQKALDVSSEDEFEYLVSLIRPHISALKQTALGKRISTKILKRFPALEPGYNDGRGIQSC